MLDNLVQKLQAAKSVVLSTHRNSDGDGLGAQLALFHGLRKLGKLATVINPDPPAQKYGFLDTDRWVQTAEGAKTRTDRSDLCLILDTNDRRLVEPLISRLEQLSSEVIFVDHHPLLSQGPQPTQASFIDTEAASTGEIAFRLLKMLGVPLDATIARALYTSLVFDTQNFRYIKSGPASHLMAAELLAFEKNPEEIHRKLFATYTAEKMKFVARTLSQVDYANDGKTAFVFVRAEDARASGMNGDETGDVIDQLMNIQTVEAAVLLREDSPENFKISLRSKGLLKVLPLAEKLGGGGHLFAAGAYVKSKKEDLSALILNELELLVLGLPTPTAGRGRP